ncbi:hypothetical protein OKW22_000683 [Bacilli bacterium PM5-3]|nr:hypothetical protein [Bacilli bacterium PM5-3]
MNNNFIDGLKMIELSRFFMSKYNYREVEIKNVEGIFIENRMAKYPLIRICSKSFQDIAQFNEDLAVIKRVIVEYKTISQLEDVRCLCIYFDGVVEEKVDDIYSLVLKDNSDISQSAILSSEFPLLSSLFNLDQVNQFLQNNQTPSNSGQTQERKITEMFSFKEISKKTKFTRYFSLAFIFINIFAMYILLNTTDFFYNFAWYDVFFTQLGQYYRLFTGLFLNNSFLSIFIFLYVFYQYNSYIEIRLGTKKTMIVYGIGLLMIFASMLFVGGGNVYLGSFPIIALLAGAYIGTIFLPSEKNIIKLNLRNLIFISLITISFALGVYVNYIGALIAFFTGFVCVFALNIKEKEINRSYLYILPAIFICMVVLKFIPNQALARDLNFEKSYISYVKYDDEHLASSYENRIDKHYKKIGVIDYDE